MSAKSNFRNVPDYGQMGYSSGYGYVSWNGRPKDGENIEEIALVRARSEHIPEGEPMGLYVSNFIRYINEH